MNYSHSTQRLALLAALLLTTYAPFARSKPGDAVGNLLTLNGKPLDYSLFSIRTKGVLALIAVNPETADVPKIPFRIYLRRGNQPIGSAGCLPGRSISEIEVSQVLSAAKPGDFLIVEPVGKEKRDVRAIKITAYIPAVNWVFPYWLFGLRKSDGC